MLKHWAIVSLSLRDKAPVGSYLMWNGGDQADKGLAFQICWRTYGSDISR